MHAWNARPGERESSGAAGASTRVSIRDVTDEDLKALLELWHELMDLHVALDERFQLAPNADQRFYGYIETARSRDDYFVRLAADGPEIVGFAVSCILPNSPVYQTRWIGYINDLCVAKAARRQGIGKRLAVDAVRWLTQSGAETVEVYVAKRNQTAVDFWHRIGGTDYLERLTLDVERLQGKSRAK
ncbi:MAG: GNAT family N-acetyltransferase [Deltaproteobacteria bacterium]|nr:GNAT family N-acetyltransferase [Deltaproteobacteria bacterium]